MSLLNVISCARFGCRIFSILTFWRRIFAQHLPCGQTWAWQREACVTYFKHKLLFRSTNFDIQRLYRNQNITWKCTTRTKNSLNRSRINQFGDIRSANWMFVFSRTITSRYELCWNDYYVHCHMYFRKYHLKMFPFICHRKHGSSMMELVRKEVFGVNEMKCYLLFFTFKLDGILFSST